MSTTTTLPDPRCVVCGEPAVMAIDGLTYCLIHVEEGFEAVGRKAVNKEKGGE